MNIQELIVLNNFKKNYKRTFNFMPDGCLQCLIYVGYVYLLEIYLTISKYPWLYTMCMVNIQ